MSLLTFTIKQHTPIIHFQSEQEGATLRASEVKPKLDRFIIQKMKDDGTQIPDSWYSVKDKGALDYRLKVKTNGMPLIDVITIIPPAIDKWVLSTNDLELIFTVMSNSLKSKINEVFKQFLLQTNFGKRQSKGFGCFYTKDTNEKDFNVLGKRIYKLNSTINIANPTNFYSMITTKWRELKSGIQHPSYKKSQLFKYMFANEMRWDKRWFKVNINDEINGTERTKPNNLFPNQLLVTRNEPLDVSDIENDLVNNRSGYFNYTDNSEYNDTYFFGRALLGLAEHYEFRTSDRTKIYKVNVLSDKIERFKSPVTFKVFNNQVFAIAESIPDDIKDVEFSFELMLINSNTREVISEKENFPPSLTTPATFNLHDFLDNHFGVIGFYRLNS